MIFYTQGNGKNITNIDLFDNLKAKVDQAEGKSSILSLFEFNLLFPIKRHTFTEQDAEIIGKVCTGDFIDLDHLWSRKDNFPKDGLSCYNCIMKSLNPDTCSNCAKIDTYGNTAKSYLREESPMIDDIKQLRKFVDEKHSMYFV